ncbi:glycosyltransferase family 4 protein, partial [Thermodesulfovibrio yellowstonii]
VGSGFKRKGVDTLLKALTILKDQEIFLIVIGKGDIKQYLKMCKNLDIEKKVLFLGIRKDIENFYALADLFILPTIYDPFSNATLEAMATGLPVITTKNNGASELIEEGKEGFSLEDPFNHLELADKINLALKDIERMGDFARKKAEQFPIERATEEFMECIKRFL